MSLQKEFKFIKGDFDMKMSILQEIVRSHGQTPISEIVEAVEQQIACFKHFNKELDVLFEDSKLSTKEKEPLIRWTKQQIVSSKMVAAYSAQGVECPEWITVRKMFLPQF